MKNEMKKRLKGLLSAALVFVMVLVMLPLGGMEVKAANAVLRLDFSGDSPSSYDKDTFEPGEAVSVELRTASAYGGESGFFHFYPDETLDITSEFSTSDSYYYAAGSEYDFTLPGQSEMTGNTANSDKIPTGKVLKNWKLHTESYGTTYAKINFYAVWDWIDFNIDYDLAGGALEEGVTNPESFNYGTATFTLNNPKRSGYVFNGWSGAATNLTGFQGELGKEVTIPNATLLDSVSTMKFTATWLKLYTVTVDNGTVEGVAAYQYEDPAPASKRVSISANTASEGYEFDKWVVKSVENYEGTLPNITFDNLNAKDTYMTVSTGADVEIEATYKKIPYNVTVNSGTVKDGATHTIGETVTITAGTAPEGKRFKSWTVVSGSVTLADSTSAETTFTMPAGNVEVTAEYEVIPKYMLTVENGSGSGEYAAGERVYVTMNVAPEGKQFKEWKVISGDVTLMETTQSSMSFLMPACNVTIKAVYENIVPTTTESTTETTAKPATETTSAEQTTAPQSTAENPQTGDNSRAGLLSMLAVGAASVAVAAVRRKKEVKE